MNEVQNRKNLHISQLQEELKKVTSEEFIKKEFLTKTILQAYTILQEKTIC